MLTTIDASLARMTCAFILTMVVCAQAGEFELRVVDAETGKPIGARVELTDARGRHPKIRRSAAFDNHFTVAGAAVLPITGNFQFKIQSGPEYLEQAGSIIVARDATDNKTLRMKRFVNMASDGWWSGDPWAERSRFDASLLLVGEDLHLLGMPKPKDPPTGVAKPPITNRAVDAVGQAFTESGGRLHVWQRKQTDDDAARAIDQLANPLADGHIQIATPAGWDLPIWVATQNVDSILLHQATTPHRALPTGRPFDKTRYPGSLGIGRYHEAIYHHLLNSGLRIPPSASSLSGITNEPPGTYRTYVHLDGEFSADAWWNGLRDGRVMITNGPLIIANINGELPGHVFRAADNGTVSLDVKLTLHMREKVDYLQFIKDGKSVREVRLDDWAKANGKLAPLDFDESGWLIVRAVTNHGGTYRYAATAPYYIEIGDQPRISRKSTQFFLDWVTERAKILKSTNDPHRQSMLPHLRAARTFWQDRLDAANAP